VNAQQASPDISVSRSGVTVEPASGRIGAEITGIDISQPLDDATVEVVRHALDTWKVVFFRGQKLDHAAQIAFGRRFGHLTYAHPHDDAPPESYPEIYTVDDRRLSARLGFDAKARRLQVR
jgi:alpha-ketoglutarate-dependent sulfate ester dioxygenase